MLHQSQKNIKRVGFSSQEAVREKIYKCKAKENTPQKNTKRKAKSQNVIAYGMKQKKKQNKKTEMIFLLISFNTQTSL